MEMVHTHTSESDNDRLLNSEKRKSRVCFSTNLYPPCRHFTSG